MNKTLMLSFSLKNTYRVNAILYSLKQIPLVKKLLPDTLYSVSGLKVLANVVSALWEVTSTFLRKLLYLLGMVYGAGFLYQELPEDQVFLHLLLLLTLVGGFTNTHLFNPSKDKYYAMFLLRMDARTYSVVHYTYAIVKVIAGFLPLTLWLGLWRGLPLWLCLLLPFAIAGCKLTIAASSIWNYERRGVVYNENKLSKYLWLGMTLLLGAAYGLPALGIALPAIVSTVLMLAFLPAGAVSIRKIYLFKNYKMLNHDLLGQTAGLSKGKAQIIKVAAEKNISADSTITSRKKGFEYLNELFIRRHQTILWNTTRTIAYVCAFLVCSVILVLWIRPEVKPFANNMIMTFLPYFTFIMYIINRGTSFTQALFMNCDHSLLTYPFYKQPRFILKLFQIRLREIMKINAVPALVIGVGLALILYVSGGTDNSLNYVILIVSILSVSLFFSVHYLTIYYLLQPYNVGTEIKSGMYRIIMVVTYCGCFYLMQLRMSTLVFGIMTIAFCLIYSILACVLVYLLAPKTFKMRV